MRLLPEGKIIAKYQLDFWGDEQACGGEVFFDLFIGFFVGGYDYDFVVFGEQILLDIPDKIGFASFDFYGDFFTVFLGDDIDSS